MLFPCAPLDALLLLRAPWLFVAPSLIGALTVVLVSPLLLPDALLLLVLVLPLRLLGTLLLLLPVVRLLLLSMLRAGLGLLVLALLLFGVAFLLLLLLLLRIERSSNSEKQRESCRGDDSN
jgi:hypothetical protein